MLLLTDVFYPPEGGARAAGVVLEDWTDAAPLDETTVDIPYAEPYVSGRFFQRELPCLLQLCQAIDHPVRCIVVDAHAWLGSEPGLGAHLCDAVGRPVVGVAKAAFHEGGASPILRGASKTPLFVSAAEMPNKAACSAIATMAGPYRIPTMLKRVDQLSRGLAPRD